MQLKPHEAALDELLANGGLRGALEVLVQREHARLHSEEDAKDHPLKAFALSDAEWADFRAHVLDGGGVVDDVEVRQRLHQALYSDNQAEFWPLLVHWLKSRLKTMGSVRPLPHGGVAHHGVG
jgi:hypothetical protein